MINISFDEKSLAAAKMGMMLAPKETRRAASKAVNRTLTHVRSTMSKTARQRYVVKAAEIKKSLKTKRASAGSLSGEIDSAGRPIGITAFKMSVRKKGPVKVKILRQGSLKPVKGLFVNHFPSGYVGPMYRKQRSRYPLSSFAGPSAPQMIGNKNVLPKWEKDAEEFLNRQFLHEVDYRISKLLGG